jgi:putative nucleotidyltransferase with HDIG domain
VEDQAVDRQYALRPAENFSYFPVDRLVDNSVTDFDLFISLERHFILYSGNGYKWHRAELTELLQAGHEQFFIRSEDLPKAQMYEAIVKLPKIQAELAPPERIQRIEQVGALFVKCLYEGELTPACVEKGKTLADAMTACIAEDKSCIKYLSGLADHDYYTYYHSVRVSAYATAIAISMGLRDEAFLRAIALGALFHDIGKKEIPISLLNKTGALTEAEWKVMRSHPLKGFEKIEETILAHIPREIVLHHHEKRNGAGYPHGLDKGSLLPEVQIATLADIFDALTSARAYQTKRTRYEALDFIKHRLLKEEVCPDAFRALILCLAA